MEIKDRIFNVNAILSGNHYKHFGIHEVTCSLYGYKKEDIINLEIKISENQVKPDLNDGNMDADYWGWYSFEDDDISMIYPKLFLMAMCFPNGYRVCEQNNEGKAYRLEIINKYEYRIS